MLIKLFENNIEINNVTIISIIFKQREHEFARLAIAINENVTQNITNIKIDNFFQGNYQYQIRDKTYKWLIFIGYNKDDFLSNQLENIEKSEDLLYCNPFSHQITSLYNNQNKKIDIINILEFRQYINNQFPSLFNFYHNNCYIKNDILEETKEIIIEDIKNIPYSNYLSIVKKLEKYGNLKILKHNNQDIKIIINYNNNIENIYHLQFNVANNLPEAFGYEKINFIGNYTIIEKKIKKSSAFIKNYIKIVLNTNIQIGNTIQYNQIIGIISEIKHIIANNNSYTVIIFFSSPYLSINIETTGHRIKLIKQKEIPLIKEDKNIKNIEDTIIINSKNINKIKISKPYKIYEHEEIIDQIIKA